MKKSLLELMSNNLAKLARFLLIIILIPAFLTISVPKAEASPKKKTISSVKKKKGKKRRGRRSRRSRRVRNYNPDKTRTEAIQMILENSDEVTELAGLSPALDKQKMIEAEPDLATIGDMGEDIEELTKEDDVSIDLDQFKTLWIDYLAGGEGILSITQGGLSKENIMSGIMDWLGTPYKFGATSRSSIDCSAFTQRIFFETCKVLLPRTARSQFEIGDVVKDRSKLQFGDLIFFHTYSRKFASHVGIYLGDDLFAHASSRYGVTVSSLNSSFYDSRYIGARRLDKNELTKLAVKKGEDTLASH